MRGQIWHRRTGIGLVDLVFPLLKMNFQNFFMFPFFCQQNPLRMYKILGNRITCEKRSSINEKISILHEQIISPFQKGLNIV